MIDRLMRTKTTQEWMDILHDNNIPGAPVQTMDQVFEMPQIQDRHMEIKMSHPATDREISLVGSPLKLSGTPVSYREPPPRLGQHTEEILANILKLTPERIEELKKNGKLYALATCAL